MTIDFYFDFLSPYGYFAVEKIEAIAAKHNRSVEYHPMLLGIAVRKVMGLKPLLETPLKSDYLLKGWPRLSALYDVPYQFPSRMPHPIPPARAVCWAKNEAPDKVAAYVREIYRAQWRDDKDVSEPQLLAEIAESVGINSEGLVESLDSDKLRQQLTAEVNASLERGVFGSPTFAVDEELIWGCDRLWMLEHWLANGSWESIS